MMNSKRIRQVYEVFAQYYDQQTAYELTLQAVYAPFVGAGIE